MIINFLGAARTVTGSQFLLEVNDHRLLLECGLFQGKRAESITRNRNFVFDVTSVDAVLLSHAHIDHSGNLPNLVRNGYRGPIYATSATASLAEIMLLDSAHVQEMDVQYLNKKRAKRGEPPVEPLYTTLDAGNVLPLLRPLAYDEEFEPVPGVTVRMEDAGHILGSAGVVLDVKEKGRRFRLWFSGDIGRLKLPLLRDPILPEKPTYLMMECTYGDKSHNDPDEAYVEFREVIRKTVQRGGKVIIPAFAVGRTQELVYFLNKMISEQEIPRIPVFVDSPLAVNATRIFRKFPELFDDETNEFIRQERHPALSFDQLTYVGSVEESKRLNERREPMVIISASGMAEAGRILHHLKNNIEDPRNTICIVSWQAPHTLGRRLADRETEVRIFGETYRRKAEVATIGGLSSHAGQDMLVNYARAGRGDLKQIFLVHGEAAPAAALQGRLNDSQDAPVLYPELGQSVEI